MSNFHAIPLCAKAHCHFFKLNDEVWTMKKIISLLIILFFLLPSTPVQGAEKKKTNEAVPSTHDNNKTAEYPPDIQRILDRGKIVVGLYFKDKPPFIMTDPKGGLYGLDIDLAGDIAKRLGVDVEFNREAKTYKELHQIAANGQTARGNPVDVVISKFSRTYERAKSVRYTQPYLTFRQALIVNKMHVSKNNVEDYPMDYLRQANVKIGVREKTSYVEYAGELFKNAQIIEGNWEDIVKMVVEGKLTAVIRDEYEIMKLIKRNPELAIKISVYILRDRKDHIAMAVPCKSINLLAWLDMYLETRPEALTAKDIIKKYPEAWK
jgi:polar amino acid transport system substrate-binding protein